MNQHQHTGIVRVLNNEDMWIASFKELADAEKWAVENDELTPRVKVVLIDEPTLEDKLQMSILANTLRALLDTQGIEQVQLLLQEAERTPRMYFPVTEPR